ncbi:MAG: NAD-dependent epimerase/dehydratase family protein [Bacillaceae bacterium]
MSQKTALIAGSTGLIGKSLLNDLLQGDAYEKVIAIVRRPQGIAHSKLIEIIIEDFDQLGTIREYFAVDDVFCCLGTTIKKAKSQQTMEKIDVEYPHRIAKLAHEMGATQFLLVSAIGANPNSNIFYSRIKGELEVMVKKIPFKGIFIFRPSALLGKREEFRLGEKISGTIMSLFSFLFVGKLRKYKAIKGETVALAMYYAAQQNKDGIFTYETKEMENIIRSFSS